MDGLIDRLRYEANNSDSPRQRDRLNALADEFAAALEAEREEVAALEDEVEAAWEEVAELRAARIAYASEFPETKDGGPDTGNIHANIRSLKARAERLEEALETCLEVEERPSVIEMARAALRDHDQENKA